MDLEYPSWQKPLADAILEFPLQLREKLRCAEEAINSRIQELRLAENQLCEHQSHPREGGAGSENLTKTVVASRVESLWPLRSFLARRNRGGRASNPELSICLDCGRAEFVVPEPSWSSRKKGTTTRAINPLQGMVTCSEMGGYLGVPFMVE